MIDFHHWLSSLTANEILTISVSLIGSAISGFNLFITRKTLVNTEILNSEEYNRITLKLKYSLEALVGDLREYLKTKDDIFINTNPDSIFHNLQTNFGDFIKETKNPYIIINIHKVGKIMTKLGGVLNDEKRERNKSSEIISYIKCLDIQINSLKIISRNREK